MVTSVGSWKGRRQRSRFAFAPLTDRSEPYASARHDSYQASLAIKQRPEPPRNAVEPTALLQLSAQLSARIRGTVHVEIEVAGLERFHLIRVEFRSAGCLVHVTVFSEWDDHRPVLAGGSDVDVRRRPLYALGHDTAGHRAVIANRDLAFATRGRCNRRHLVRAGKFERHVGAKCCTTAENDDRDDRGCKYDFLIRFIHFSWEGKWRARSIGEAVPASVR